MNMQMIKAIAKKMSIEPGSLNKMELIRSIQEKEGNAPCFKSNPPSCGQLDCCWRSDCKPGGATSMA